MLLSSITASLKIFITHVLRHEKERISCSLRTKYPDSATYRIILRKKRMKQPESCQRSTRSDFNSASEENNYQTCKLYFFKIFTINKLNWNKLLHSPNARKLIKSKPRSIQGQVAGCCGLGTHKPFRCTHIFICTVNLLE